MKTLKMHGASDDLIESEGIDGADEFAKFASATWPYVASFKVTSHEAMGGLNIHVLYDGCWSFAVSADESEQLPGWPIRRTWGGGRGYSELLEIDVPDDAVIQQGL
jgi:hypothetical protein